MSVYSRAITAVEHVINVQAHLNKSVLNMSNGVEAVVAYAEVRQGIRPVINATVIAFVERPGDDTSDVISLYDNGAG